MSGRSGGVGDPHNSVATVHERASVCPSCKLDVVIVQPSMMLPIFIGITSQRTMSSYVLTRRGTLLWSLTGRDIVSIQDTL